MYYPYILYPIDPIDTLIDPAEEPEHRTHNMKLP